MKGFITIVAASALLSASLVAGLAGTETTQPRGQDANRPQDVAAQASRDALPANANAEGGATTAWIDRPAKANAACREAAWPYRTALCAAADRATGADARQRKVRVILAEGRREHGSADSTGMALR